MITRLNLSIPLNSLSLGQVSFNILRELYRRKIQCVIHPKGGNVDLSAYKIDPQFGSWIQQSVNTRYKKTDRKVPTLAVWHIGDSHFKPSDKQYLFSFHETDSPTDEEINIVNQQEYTFFSSSWSVDNFRQYGVAEDKVGFTPLGLDEDFKVNPISLPEINWLVCGKWEQRKGTQQIIQTWIRKYGNNPKHKLNLCVTNPFFQPQQMDQLYAATFGGQKPFNVNVLPHLKTNAEVAQLINATDIDLSSSLSGSEGWGLPGFNATAMGKWAIVTNVTAHKDWANAENAILLEPNGMRPVYDGVFFHQGAPFSQGSIYTFNPDDLVAAMEKAEQKAKTVNTEGLKLGERFTYRRTVDEILAKIGD